MTRAKVARTGVGWAIEGPPRALLQTLEQPVGRLTWLRNRRDKVHGKSFQLVVGVWSASQGVAFERERRIEIPPPTPMVGLPELVAEIVRPTSA